MVWPFTTKADDDRARKAHREAQIDRLRRWRPIGGRFEFLGRTCIVSAHSTRVRVRETGQELWRAFPCLQANYADNNGVIHEIAFSMDEAEVLMREQPDAYRLQEEKSA